MGSCPSTPSRTHRPKLFEVDPIGPLPLRAIKEDEIGIDCYPPMKKRLLNSGAAVEIASEPSTSATCKKADDSVNQEAHRGTFTVIAAVPSNHVFKAHCKQPVNAAAFQKRVREEIELLKSSLPPGVTVKAFEGRLDLFSVMIEGPEGTPYEDGLFFFDVLLPPEYPTVPPRFRYLSFCSSKLNPNLYECGLVCCSLLGTWDGNGVELWSGKESNLLRVLLSIQGLILVAEPYFNEPGLEKKRSTKHGKLHSRSYNETILMLMIQSMTNILKNPPEAFSEKVRMHFAGHARRFIERLEKWVKFSRAWNRQKHSHKVTREYTNEVCCADLKPNKEDLPEFHLLPATLVFCENIEFTLEVFKRTLNNSKY